MDTHDEIATVVIPAGEPLLIVERSLRNTMVRRPPSPLLVEPAGRRVTLLPDKWRSWNLFVPGPDQPYALGYRREATTTFKHFKEQCPELAQRWQHLTIDDARTFQNRLMKKHKPMTVRKHLTCMRALWNACKRVWVRDNPWAELQFPRSGADAEDWHYHSDKEVAVLLGQADLAWKARIKTTLTWYSKVNKADAERRIRQAQSKAG